MIRGQVVPLMGSERLNRMLYLAKQIGLSALDAFIRKDAAPEICPDIYYLLREHNGGKDPTAPDPADRWMRPGKTFVNRTCDCIGGMAWCGGFDRYQPDRFQHIYEGWINTDSMRMDARGKEKCFVKLDQPEVGCYVVYESDKHHRVHGHETGHIGGVIGVPNGFDPKDRNWWKSLKVVDVAKRDPNPANKITTGLGWYATDAYFVIPTMQP